MVGNNNDDDDDDDNKDNDNTNVERNYLCPGSDTKITSKRFVKFIAPDFTEWHPGYKYRFDIFPVVFQIQGSPVGRSRVSAPRQTLEELLTIWH